MRMERPPTPGTRIELVIPADDAPGTRYRWMQMTGPSVAIDDPTKSTIAVTVPETSEPLLFLRVGSSREFVRIVRVEVPVGRAANDSKGPAVSKPSLAGSSVLRADAGDDQVGLVGHRVTLNGSRSSAAEKLVHRWIQLSGPQIVAPQQDRAFYSFIPSAPGVYRLALVVANSASISEPDEVTVLVGVGPQGTAGALGSLAPTQGAVANPAASVATPDQILRTAVPNLPNGRVLAGQIAGEFKFLAGRASLYSSFADLQHDLGRRLDAVIPPDAAQRQAWAYVVFQPLTQYTTSQMLGLGLDIRQPSGMNGKLSDTQKDRIQEHLKALSEAFRAVSAAE